MSEPLVSIEHLKQYFPIRKGLLLRTVGHVKAVDDVSLSIAKGETLGLVGESGCGKTTLGRTVLRLIEPSSGAIRFEGKDIAKLDGAALRNLRRDMQIVFQDPYGSLNPRMTVRAIVEEGLLVHRIGTAAERLAKVRSTLELVGLDPRYLNRYPHEFSGGQRQRLSIARALVLDPKFVVLDEPISALDVSIQSQVVNLLARLRKELGLTYLFISHDLSVVEYLSDRVAVMYLGGIVELGGSSALYHHSLHPYTHALLSSIPSLDPTRKRRRILLSGDVPSPANPPRGCRFHPRCPIARDVCKQEVPPLVQIGSHSALCHAVKDHVTALGDGATEAAVSQRIAAEIGEKAPAVVPAA